MKKLASELVFKYTDMMLLKVMQQQTKDEIRYKESLMPNKITKIEF